MFTNFIKPKLIEKYFIDQELEELGKELKKKIYRTFKRSLAIRSIDSGSDNAPEIELNNLNTPYYDIERFGITFVASPRHADLLMISGPITLNMLTAVKKTYEATPAPKIIVALGDDACGIGIFKDSYAVIGGVEKILPVDLKIYGNPPSPKEIIKGLLRLIK